MVLTFGEYSLDLDRRLLSRGAETVPVEPQVFDLIWLLAQNADRVVSRDEIIDVVWQGRIVSESAISARIAAARKALRDDGKRQAMIRTVARHGLQMVAPVSQDPPPQPLDVAPRITAPGVRYAKSPQGQMVAYTVAGKGPPVVNASFFGCAVEMEWSVASRRAILAPLVERHQVACFDCIGTGLSDRDMSAVTMEVQAEIIGTVADAAGFDQFAIFSESGSSLETITYAAANPDRVSRIVFSGAYAEGRVRRGGKDEVDFIRSLIAEGWDGSPNAYTRAYLMAYCPDGPHDEANEVARMMQSSVAQAEMLIERDLCNNASVMDLLGQVRCPVFLVHARHDIVHPLSEAQKIARGIPNAQLHVLESGNHLPQAKSEAMDDFVAVLLSFLGEDTW